MHFEDWYKKHVTLRWEGLALDLAVAQELFSSHEVDRGSLLLLRSLDADALPEQGRCLDYGCGYGVLGLGLKAKRPAWDVTLVDRDALAVSFSAWNAEQLGMVVDCRGGLDPIDAVGGGYDLILWNVPGKAGATVLAALTGETLDALAPGGMLALVVVHPLAETVMKAAVRADIESVLTERGPEHTVLHLQRRNGQPQPGVDGFDHGIFDREAIVVERDRFRYDLVPVVGLPQYDGPDLPTLLVMDLLARIEDVPTRVLCQRTGVGHLPVAATMHWPEAQVTLVDRDLLALRAAGRALQRNGVPMDRIATRFAPDLDGLQLDAVAMDLAIVMIDHQMRMPVMRRLFRDLVACSRAGTRIVIGGASTEVSRMQQQVRAQKDIRLRVREKRKGFSAAMFACR